jgi:hypothetical protein
MKYLILLICSISFAQNCRYSDQIQPGTYTEYTSKNNTSIKTGDKIRIGFPSNGNYFTYITQGNESVHSKLNNILVEITKIEAVKLQNGYTKTYAYFKGFGSLPVQIDIEAAIHFKEILP